MNKEAENLILYLDDEEPNLITFKYSLGKYYSIQLADNSKKALDILESNKIKVMIVDQRMPDITGLEFIAKVKKKYPDIISIILTAHADLDLTLKAINQGSIYQFLSKPWEINHLCNTINNAIEKYDLQVKNKNLFRELQEMNIELEMNNEELLATTDQLRDHEDKFRTLFENANDVIFLIKDGKFVDCNRSALEIFDCSKGQIIGKSPIDFSTKHQPNGEKSEKLLLKNLQKALEGEKVSFEWKHIQLNRNPIDADVSLNLIELNGENFLQAIIRDITEKKETDRKVLNTIIEKVEKERKQFATNLQIDIESLLSSIKQLLNVLHNTKDSEEKQNVLNKCYEVIDLAITRTREISNNLNP